MDIESKIGATALRILGGDWSADVVGALEGLLVERYDESDPEWPEWDELIYSLTMYEPFPSAEPGHGYLDHKQICMAIQASPLFSDGSEGC